MGNRHRAWPAGALRGRTAQHSQQSAGGPAVSSLANQRRWWVLGFLRQVGFADVLVNMHSEVKVYVPEKLSGNFQSEVQSLADAHFYKYGEEEV